MEESAFDTNQIFCDAQIFTLHARYGERMTIAQVQPLNIVAASKARAFLCEADILVTDVRSLFFNSGDFAMAARLKDIQGRLADEIRALERLIAASKPGLRH
jgi:hypothetical protein